MSVPTKSDELLMDLFSKRSTYMSLLKDEQDGALNEIGYGNMLIAREQYVTVLNLACETGYALSRIFRRRVKPKKEGER